MRRRYSPAGTHDGMVTSYDWERSQVDDEPEKVGPISLILNHGVEPSAAEAELTLVR